MPLERPTRRGVTGSERLLCPDMLCSVSEWRHTAERHVARRRCRLSFLQGALQWEWRQPPRHRSPSLR